MKSLFDYPATRRSDPLSSYRAENRITASGRRGKQAMEVYEALCKHNGSTSRELERFMCQPEIAHRRLPDLEKIGWIVRGPMRLCAVCGQKCLTWKVTRKVNDEQTRI